MTGRRRNDGRKNTGRGGYGKGRGRSNNYTPRYSNNKGKGKQKKNNSNNYTTGNYSSYTYGTSNYYFNQNFQKQNSRFKKTNQRTSWNPNYQRNYQQTTTYSNFSQNNRQSNNQFRQSTPGQTRNAYKKLKERQSIIEYPIDWLRKIKPNLYISQKNADATQQAVMGIRQQGHLIIKDSQLTSQQFDQIIQVLTNSRIPLTNLTLVKTLLDNQDGSRLIDQLKTQKTLRFVALSNNQLFTEQLFISFIDNVLEQQDHLEELYLIQTVGGLGNDALARLAGFLANSNCQLKKLGIIDNKIDKKGMTQVLNGLKRNDRLEELYISECSSLGDDGLIELGALLTQKNCNLRVCQLNNTNLGDTTLEAISKALLVNKKLDTLELRYNQFTTTGAQALCNSLLSNEILSTIDLRYNKLQAQASEPFILFLEDIAQRYKQHGNDDDFSELRHMPKIELFNPDSQAPTNNVTSSSLIQRQDACKAEYEKISWRLLKRESNSSAVTYLFYDLETSGLHKAFDQVTQFAAMKTDENFIIIERYNYAVKLNPDTVPHPWAFLTHGVTPQSLNDMGRCENEVMLDIYRLFKSTTYHIGYYSINFDYPFLRFSFHRNFLRPYEFNRQAKDLYPIVAIFKLLHGTSLACKNIQWPTDGSLKLADIIRANPVAHYERNAHDALVDVEDTINIAREHARNNFNISSTLVRWCNLVDLDFRAS